MYETPPDTQPFAYIIRGAYAGRPSSSGGGSSTGAYIAPPETTPTPILIPLVVDFIGAPLSGTAPVTVVFSDLTTGGPTSWSWDFKNDGSATSIVQNPSYTYTSPGVYSVKLITSNEAAGSVQLVKTAYIVVSGPVPVVNFTGSPLTGVAPLTVAFSDSSTNSPTSWLWDFQDNASNDSTGQNPSFTYTSAGVYSVKLGATNAYGSGTLTKNNYVTVTAPLPASVTLDFQALGLSATTTSGIPVTNQYASLGFMFSGNGAAVHNNAPELPGDIEYSPPPRPGAGSSPQGLLKITQDVVIQVLPGFNFNTLKMDYAIGPLSVQIKVFYRPDGGGNVHIETRDIVGADGWRWQENFYFVGGDSGVSGWGYIDKIVMPTVSAFFAMDNIEFSRVV